MFGKFSAILICFFGALACAKSNYKDTTGLTSEQKLSSGCSQALEACTQITWQTMPTETATGSFQLEFFSSVNPSERMDITGDVKVVLWMPSMGHGSSPVTVEKISSGVYKVDRVFFVMPGEWEIRIQIKNGNNVSDEIVQKVSI
jgi:hypothetical protein